MILDLLVYLCIGVFSGYIAGLFGVGGGMIIVPALTLSFTLHGLPSAIVVHMAVATSLAVIVLTAISSIKQHHNQGAVRTDLLRLLAPGLVVGAFAGAWVAKQIPALTLELGIGLFAWFVAGQMLYNNLNLTKPQTHTGITSLAKTPYITPVQSGAGLLIGGLSAIFGIGGGTFTVPYLTAQGISIQQAVGTAAAAGLPIALAGAVAFMLFSPPAGLAVPHTLGYVYLPAFIGIALTAVWAARLGALKAHQLSTTQLKLAFALLLFVVGLVFIGKALW